jgi:hypothetical protein
MKQKIVPFILSSHLMVTNSRFNRSLGQTLLISFLSVVVFFINYKSNWIFGDDIEFLTSTAIGKAEPMSRHAIIDGRFWPFGHYDFNLLTLLPFGYTSEFHYVYLSLWFILLFIFLLKLIIHLSNDSFGYVDYFFIFFVLIIIICGSDIIQVYMDVIFPEKTILTMLAFFMLLFYQFLRTNKSKYLIIIIPFIIWSTYCKEVMFILYGSIGLSLLLWNKKLKIKGLTLFSILLLVNSLIYILLYYLIVFRHANTRYSVAPCDDYIISVIKNVPIVFIILLACSIRLYFIFAKHDNNHVFSDSMLMGGTMYILSFFVLRYNSPYYFTPAVILFVPTLSYWGNYYLKYKKVHFALISVLVFAFLIKPIHLFPYTIKNYQMHRVDDMKTIDMALKHIRNNDLVFFNKKDSNYTFNDTKKYYVKNVLRSFMAFRRKKTFAVEDVLILDSIDYPTLNVTSQDYKKMTSDEKIYLYKYYNRLVEFGDLGIVLYTLKSKCKENLKR